MLFEALCCSFAIQCAVLLYFALCSSTLLFAALHYSRCQGSLAVPPQATLDAHTHPDRPHYLKMYIVYTHIYTIHKCGLYLTLPEWPLCVLTDLLYWLGLLRGTLAKALPSLSLYMFQRRRRETRTREGTKVGDDFNLAQI